MKNCERRNCTCPAQYRVLNFNLCQACMDELREGVSSVEQIEQNKLIEQVGNFKHTIPGSFSKKLLFGEEVMTEFGKLFQPL